MGSGHLHSWMYNRSGAHNMNNRNALFGNRSGQPNSFGDSYRRGEEATQNEYEQKNNEDIESLSAQVGLLKELTLEINGEVKSQNSFLDGMGTSFSGASDLLGNTMVKLNSMMSSTGNLHLCHLVAFMVFVFIALYFMFTRRG